MSEQANPTPEFAMLAEIHVQMAELFLRHQEALLDRDWPGASSALARFREGLLLHMEHEEGLLLPLMARAGKVERWPARVYLGEHEKLRRLLARATTQLEALPQATGRRDENRALLALLDFETTFKHLCEHHEQREEMALFPLLDQVSTIAERRDRLAQIEATWQAYLDRTSPTQ
ncbi:Hemerythrin domain-containing protein [Sulfidibacter corallicola]|uniref:Hemerythrin domain-containing protein n=1 Tax=Sulfidibacter corallicola TaxID=2818388 RepID=A0A8A4TPJ6_SULCO|nr:hemerythrin domain-containing protein [Sulfidibacter corallicola]QTD51896.1 hemerythrin domain-containing protein [Sulfidibacter corallicola]